jgi:hypothetical protein
LLSDALNFAIFISSKFGDEIEIVISYDNLMDEEASVVLELTYLLFQLQK